MVPFVHISTSLSACAVFLVAAILPSETDRTSPSLCLYSLTASEAEHLMSVDHLLSPYESASLVHFLLSCFAVVFES